ncbi:hypothetical protein D9X91_21385 [Falsibacillus albus]|uniref:Uncharacterized protein n=1 Tax=Falsibacillus albus TaxID=2478915 RepID=A0A3L7JK45_9BACI|nr:hypothetical protein D9X91_21385 [Falsibacillus albus]
MNIEPAPVHMPGAGFFDLMGSDFLKRGEMRWFMSNGRYISFLTDKRGKSTDILKFRPISLLLYAAGRVK